MLEEISVEVKDRPSSARAGRSEQSGCAMLRLNDEENKTVIEVYKFVAESMFQKTVE